MNRGGASPVAPLLLLVLVPALSAGPGAPGAGPSVLPELRAGGSAFVSWTERPERCPQEAGGLPVAKLACTQPGRRHAVESVPARALLGEAVPLDGIDAATLARHAALPRRTAEAIVDHLARFGPVGDANGLRAARGVGPKTAARLASTLDFGARARPPCWNPAPGHDTGGGVMRPFLVEVLRFLPQAAISRAWGWLVRVRTPAAFAHWLKDTFVRMNGIDMSESAAPIESFACLEDLFVRKLAPGARPIDADVQTMVSPVDGHVGEVGTITDGTLLQVKGRTYTLAALLDEEEHARHFEGGAYVTLYLAPSDYHRIHAPQAGHVTSARLIPGALMPVFPEALTRVDQLFARNERIVSYLKSPDAGGIALVAVGATLVGRMRMAYDDSLRGNARTRAPRSVRYARPAWFERGEELGAFELGSTVVLICQPNKAVLDPLAFGQRVRMGERIGISQKVPRGRDQGGAPEFFRPADDE